MLRLRNGIINLSSKIVWMNLLFFVRAVGFTIEFTITSSRSFPMSLTIKILCQGRFLSFGKPNNGLVSITPLTGISGLSTSNLKVTRAPKL